MSAIVLPSKGFMHREKRGGKVAAKVEKIPDQVNADKFDGILKRLIEHKPVPKKKVKASRKKKLGSVLGT
jgi:hypothetical protein